MASIKDAVHEDPIGSAIAALLATLIVLLGVQMYLWQVGGAPDWHYYLTRHPIPDTPPPANWIEQSRDSDVMLISGRDVAYWGNPRLAYGERATREKATPRGIVFHYPMASNPIKLIQNVIHAKEHRGYHFLVTQDGRIYQAVPLSKRTNHIKPHEHRARRKHMTWMENSNTIGIAIMDGCVLQLGPSRAITSAKCIRERVSNAARAASLALAKALQTRYGMACEAVAGHGQLQTDRETFEGQVMTQTVLATCGAAKQIEARGPLPFAQPMALGVTNAAE